RHDRVADELLHGSAVALENDAQVLEVAAHARTECLGVGRLAERRRADEVAEEDGDDLALLARGLGGRCQVGSACAAEPRIVRVLAPAVRASRHGRGVYERTGWSSASSMPAASVAANAGSKRPAPTSRTEAAPAATARRIESSGSRSSTSAARSGPRSTAPDPTPETGSTNGANARIRLVLRPTRSNAKHPFSSVIRTFRAPIS